ncbi:DUF339-domain-containing protein [Acaromyces ingoldii]|uniref:Succinate dehydrogenase assembly factor 2, mitochondrial n=1 Tax=Acaromyces ingoldii TaxID=215250 RepID=A0A316YP86_9BASI|nr:DUF339-domain-containing protein [Acaromyces ingoldii]PWN90614.1 DUF339-domain-containing protein [Acaromyces ingoldii]
MSRQAQKLFRVAARSQNWQRGASNSIRPYSSDNRGSVADPGYGTPKSPAPTSTAKPSGTSDPFPLPFDPRLQGLSLASEHQSEGLSANGVALNGEEPIPLRVPGRELGMETRDVKVARLIYQARKRGTLETDLLLSTFAKEHLRSLSDGEVDEFDRLLDEPDWDIFYWLTQRKPVPRRWKESFETEGRLGWRLRVHTRNEKKETRSMPSL